MKIRHENESVYIENVEEGSCFKFDSDLWMKTDEGCGDDNGVFNYKCVNLENGYIGRIVERTKVKAVDAEVVVK